MPALFKAGAGAVREFDKDCRVALHFTNPEKTATMKWLADYLAENKVDYDVFATSYYPYYHGSLENLTEVLAYAAEKYNKLTMVAETSYPNTLADTDGFANTVAKGSNDSAADMKWSFTPQGQADEVRAVMDAVNRVPNGMGLGVFYWEGAWITVGDTTNLGGKAFDEKLNANRKLWEQFGSGWASSYAAEYDSEDAGKWYGGSSVDNQAFFAPDGSALPSLSVFRDVCGDLGDTNHDGELNIRDATAIQKHVAGIKPLDSAGLALADFNRDGKTDVADATAIQKTIAGI
jgi:arabinogalactan endo-1,4-beta-galactosidase